MKFEASEEQGAEVPVPYQTLIRSVVDKYAKGMEKTI